MDRTSRQQVFCRLHAIILTEATARTGVFKLLHPCTASARSAAATTMSKILAPDAAVATTENLIGTVVRLRPTQAENRSWPVRR